MPTTSSSPIYLLSLWSPAHHEEINLFIKLINIQMNIQKTYEKGSIHICLSPH